MKLKKLEGIDWGEEASTRDFFLIRSELSNENRKCDSKNKLEILYEKYGIMN